MKKRSGFTLIELLIVVAIIAILAAIAVPNFLEAQVRSKVSRAKADMRSAATALEAYAVDYNAYPYDGYNSTDPIKYNYWFISMHLSTPIAYMTTAKVVDPFRDQKPGGTNHWQFNDVRYINQESTWGTKFDPLQTASGVSIYKNATAQEWGGWYMTSVGPDRFYGPTGSNTLFPGAVAWTGVSNYPACPQPYDATNGTISWGDVLRSQKAPTGYTNAN